MGQKDLSEKTCAKQNKRTNIEHPDIFGIEKEVAVFQSVTSFSSSRYSRANPYSSQYASTADPL